MKRKTTTITEEFDKEGKITSRITETMEEEDSGGHIYPQWWIPPTYPNPPITWDSTKTVPLDYTTITCQNGDLKGVTTNA